jgi:hypothetical protein
VEQLRRTDGFLGIDLTEKSLGPIVEVASMLAYTRQR